VIKPEISHPLCSSQSRLLFKYTHASYKYREYIRQLFLVASLCKFQLTITANMDSLSSKFTTSRNLTYNYIHIPPSQNGNYLLFLHGFPSSSHDWRLQISYFSMKSYGIVAPDCLGYGGTSKPLDTQAYKGKAMSDDIAEILKHEEIEKVIGIGHDWYAFSI
jgi:pimeloyl-ACP methyl ester carboxylesterase